MEMTNRDIWVRVSLPVINGFMVLHRPQGAICYLCIHGRMALLRSAKGPRDPRGLATIFQHHGAARNHKKSAIPRL
jgi:hypothetical protein